MPPPSSYDMKHMGGFNSCTSIALWVWVHMIDLFKIIKNALFWRFKQWIRYNGNGNNSTPWTAILIRNTIYQLILKNSIPVNTRMQKIRLLQIFETTKPKTVHISTYQTLEYVTPKLPMLTQPNLTHANLSNIFPRNYYPYIQTSK